MHTCITFIAIFSLPTLHDPDSILYQQLVGSYFILQSLIQTSPVSSIKWTNSFLLHTQLTMLSSCALYNVLKALFSKVCTSQLCFLLSCKPILMLIDGDSKDTDEVYLLTDWGEKICISHDLLVWVLLFLMFSFILHDEFVWKI